MAEEKKKKEKAAPAVSAKSASSRMTLTVHQKAEAIALWRSGAVTLAQLSEKFKKRPETFSRMFTRMGVSKGSTLTDAAAKLEKKIEERVLSETEQTLKRLSAAKLEHFNYANGLSRIAWGQLRKAVEEKIDIASLKDVMATLKLAGDVIGNSRKELFAVLNAEKYDAIEEYDDLPELTVRELTGNEIEQIQHQPIDDMGLDSDPGALMLPADDSDGL
jgi:DNA-directed RNA polymerase subunit F